MNSKNLVLITLVCFLSSIGCQKENVPEIEDGSLWRPSVELIRGTKDISVNIYFSPIDYFKTPLKPDYFEVYMSTNPDSLKLYKRIDNIEETSLKISNLNEKTPYFIEIKSVKIGEDSITSNLRMAMLGSEPDIEKIYPELSLDIDYFEHSFDDRYLMYQTNILENERYVDKFFVVEVNNLYKQIELPLLTYGHPTWSPIENKILFKAKLSSDEKSDNIIAIVDIENEKIDTLFATDYDNYSVGEMMFSANADSIIFQSNEESVGRDYFDFWSFDLQTKQKKRLSDFSSIDNFYPVVSGFNSSLKYINNSIFFTGVLVGKGGEDIYSFDYKNGKLCPEFISDQWLNQKPYPSPSGENIVFLSSRSGKTELWLYSFSTKSLKQITGGINYPVSAFSDFEWEDNGKILLTVHRGSEEKIMRLSIN